MPFEAVARALPCTVRRGTSPDVVVAESTIVLCTSEEVGFAKDCTIFKDVGAGQPFSHHSTKGLL
jgi:hypothetical protein